jgi:hypothetical protein
MTTTSVTVPINPHAASISDNGVTLGAHGKRKGRPPKYNNCLDLAWAIEDYFEQCDDGKIVVCRDKQGREYTEQRPIPYTVGGLALHLGMYGQSWQEELGSASSEFSDCLKYARHRIESQRETGLLDGSSNVIGSIFWLKARAGWRDTPEVKDSGGINVVIDGNLFSQAKLAGASATPEVEAQRTTISIDMDTLPHTNPHITHDVPSDE